MVVLLMECECDDVISRLVVFVVHNRFFLYIMGRTGLIPT